MHYFQDLIQILTNYWIKQGCASQFGYDLEMGAGTFNPATFFRSLGPEPYHAAYLEPSRRPTDGRYGENPNRMQHFLQYQVILKPSPLNIQKLYLGSLEEMGLDLKKHDIRFVHDDWKSPSLGAWGLGWEVWVDGMEASQFTYFQQFGGQELDVIPGEITYGLERLAMYLQNVNNVYDLKWNKDLTYGDIYHQNEIEWSTYNFEASNAGMWKTTFDMAEREALDLIEKDLPIPAYDFVIKASHAFNMLDARGVISVSERTTYINRVRALACRVATIFSLHRKKIGYPLRRTPKQDLEKIPFLDHSFTSDAKEDFVLEIQTEELPQSFIPIGIQNLKKDLEKLLKSHNLSYSKLETFGSPRRLVAYIHELSFGTPQEVIEKKGPSTETAFDSHGHLSNIGKGFFDSLKLNHLSLKEIYEGKNSNLSIKELKNTPYLFVSQTIEAKSTRRIFHEHLSTLILNLDFPQKMLWSDLGIPFARPIHSLIALHGKEIIPLQIAHIHSSNSTKGHPLLSDTSFHVGHAKDYFSQLKKHHVIVNQEERKELILSELAKIEAKMKAKASHVKGVLSEVLYLCESPHLMVGSFDPKFLELPKELLELVLITHQRHFPLVDESGKLIPHFVVCLDTEENAMIKNGHERAVSPRLADGLFLFHQDLKSGLEHFNKKLKDITFQQEHGTLFDKTVRLKKHALVIQNYLALKVNYEDIETASHLLKADLASQVVFEFPELQGLMGKVYAEEEKHSKAVSNAIYEHWLPRFEEDKLPTTPLGIIFSLADKIDNLLACFLAGNIPTSSSDPFALRRQALGIIRILIEHKLHLPLQKILQHGFDLFKYQDNKEAPAQIIQFLQSRIKTVLTGYKLRPDEIQAVLASDYEDLNIYDLYLRAQSLNQFKSHALFEPLLEVFKRAKGQLNIEIKTKVKPELFVSPHEKNLHKYFLEMRSQFLSCVQSHLYSESFHLLATLHPLLAELFDHVKIMDEDTSLRMNRLSLLNEIMKLFKQLFDFSLVAKAD